eukprot:gene9250-1326_t
MVADDYLSGDFSVRSIYEAASEKHGCRKNAELLRILPDEKGRLDLLTEVNLSLNL